MSSPALETFLARLYTDEALLRAFLAAPEATACGAGLVPHDVAAMLAIDRDSLVMAARSFGAKRAQIAKLPRKKRSPWRRAIDRLRPSG